MISLEISMKLPKLIQPNKNKDRRNIMRHRNIILIISSIFMALFLLSGLDASAASVKERMLSRVGAINELKNGGLVGENNRGFLEFRSSKKPQQQLIGAENKDRKSVYAQIAKQQGIDITLVGQRRAQQLAAKGSPGQWFQKPDGSWYKK